MRTSSSNFTAQISLGTFASVDDLRPALDLCHSWVSKLRSLVNRYESTGNTSKARRSWNSFNIAFSNKGFLKYTDGLQQVKLSLLQSHLVFFSNAEILDHVSSNNSATTHLSKKLSLLALRQSSHTKILTKTQDSVTSVVQNMQAVELGLNPLIAKVEMQCLASVLKPAMENVISRHIISEFEKNHERHLYNEFRDKNRNATLSK